MLVLTRRRLCVTLGQLQTSIFVLFIFWVRNFFASAPIDHVFVLYICLHDCTCRRVAFSGLLLITLYAAPSTEPFSACLLCFGGVRALQAPCWCCVCTWDAGMVALHTSNKLLFHMCVQESHRHRSWQHTVFFYLVTCMYVWMYILGSGKHVVAFVHKSTMVLLTDVSVLFLLAR